MSHITDIFERLNLQRIQTFLVSGSELVETDSKSYFERLEEAEKPIFSIINELFPTNKESDEIISALNHYGNEIQNVYMEIGMKCGAALTMELLGNPFKKE